MAHIESRILWTIRVAALTVAFVVLCLTLLLSAWILAAERRVHEAHFQDEAKERADALAEGISNAFYALQTVNSFFATLDEEVSKEQFSVLTEPILEKYPQILSLTYQRIVPAYGNRVAANQEHKNRVVEYVASGPGDLTHSGANAFSIPEKAEAAFHSASTGEITPTRPFPLEIGKGQDRGIALTKPVYRRVLASENQSGQREILGHIRATVNASSLAHKIMQRGGFLDDSGFAVQLYIGDVNDAENRVFSHSPQVTTLSFDSGVT